jgi:hypothetical protein
VIIWANVCIFEKKIVLLQPKINKSACKGTQKFATMQILPNIINQKQPFMDDYHQQNATSKSQEIFGPAFLEGPECRPTNC